MSVSAIDQHLLGIPHRPRKKSLEARGGARRRQVSRRLRLVLKLGIGLLIVVLLLVVLWVEPVVSRYLAI
jgi:hypothetical protein